MVRPRASQWPLPGRTQLERRRFGSFGSSGLMLNLAQYDRKRMAIVVLMGTTKTVLRGGALFIRDDTLGNCLRIDTQEDPGVEFLLQENQFTGRIVKDDRYGCDFCVWFDPNCCAN